MTDDGWLRTGDLGAFDDHGSPPEDRGPRQGQFKTSKGQVRGTGAHPEGKLSAFTRIEACMVTGLAYPQPFALAMLPAGHWEALRAPEARKAFTDGWPRT